MVSLGEDFHSDDIAFCEAAYVGGRVGDDDVSA